MLVLPEEMRKELSEPLGPVVKEVPGWLAGKPVISVGDVCTITLYQSGIIPHLALVDGKTERSPHSGAERLRFDAVLHVRNPQGSITDEMMHAIKKSMKNRENTLIIVEGEEDLASLVCISEAADGFYVAYGIPGRGMCLVEVNEETRKRAEEVLSRMKKVTEA